MDLLERYLQAVGQHLAAGTKEDVLAELRVNLQAEMDDLAEEKQRPLTESEVAEINAEIVMSTDSMKRASEMIRQFIRAKGPATTSDLRQMLGNSRRVAIPLLERLDRDGITLRQGDKRALRF